MLPQKSHSKHYPNTVPRILAFGATLLLVDCDLGSQVSNLGPKSLSCNALLIINPLSPNSDQHQFSPNDIHTMSRDYVMRINKMIT